MTSPISLFACFIDAIETYDYTLAAGSLTANLYRWLWISECNPAAARPRQVLDLSACWNVDDSVTREKMAREGQWSETIAVGNLNFVQKVKSELGYKAAHREVIEGGGTYVAPGAK
jgi:hypothetical protein